MRFHALLVAAFLVLSLAICGLSVAAEELTNNSRETAVAVRITFRSKVRITGHGREFGTVEPSSGLSDVFVFSGGEVRRNRTFEVRWSPGRAIISVEWLEVYGAEEQQAMQEVADCSCILSPRDSLESRLKNAYAGIVICLEPGVYTLTQYILQLPYDVTIRGIHQDMGAARIVAPEYENVILAVRDSKLRIDGVSLGGGLIEILAQGAAVVSIESCDIQYLTLRGTAQASVGDSSLSVVIASDGARATLTNCAIEVEGEISTGVYAAGDAEVLIVDSVITNKQIGVLATGNSIVRVIRSMFINCRQDTVEADLGKVEIEG